MAAPHYVFVLNRCFRYAISAFLSDMIPLNEEYEQARLEANIDLSAEDIQDYMLHQQLDLPLSKDLIAKMLRTKNSLENKEFVQQNNR